MTTDITELAQSLKAAAEKATPGRWEYYPGNTSIEYNVDSMDEDQGSIVYVDSGDFTQAQTDRNGEFIAMANPASILALVEALEKAQAENTAGVAGMAESYETTISMLRSRIAELEESHAQVIQSRDHYKRISEEGLKQLAESRTVKLPDGWQFEECEIEGCENGAIFSVGTGSRNIHLCDKCAHEPQNSRLKKSPLSKRLPFKMSAGIKVEAE
ncbi:ead/Ea22-like family protein [Klebsiella variicola]|uniref:ead/Ea22-like family protein n=1 Tax=Klebsiella variicola TaxID=244366 RepID=UPI000E2B59A4|nr:ead/Ea22-like family protein [Klebsiella variicola]ELA0491921.1 ead/Ea22-like family protein [Klebsiella variicola]SXF36802.1 Ead domain protein [Klebsiella variicola]HDH0807631.1 ead/Ea22-like family protein [Klebsiella variicola subsp. variicola]